MYVSSWYRENSNKMTKDDFYCTPKLEQKEVSICYHHVDTTSPDLGLLFEKTPKPKGRTTFSTVHIVAPTAGLLETVAEEQVASLKQQCSAMEKTFHVHRFNFVNAASNLWFRGYACNPRPYVRGECVKVKQTKRVP
mgnify:CR=1 FL=1